MLYPLLINATEQVGMSYKFVLFLSDKKKIKDTSGKEGTVKVLSFRTPKMFCCNHPYIQTKRSFHKEICFKGTNGMALDCRI